MNPMMPINTTRWSKGITELVQMDGYAVMNYEIHNGRWCANIFGEFVYDPDCGTRVTWKTISVQQLFREALTSA